MSYYHALKTYKLKISMEIFWAKVVNLVWGLPLVIIMATASCYFAYLIRFAPLRHLRHSFLLLAGRFNSELAPGEVSHFRALSTALSGTIGDGKYRRRCGRD